MIGRRIARRLLGRHVRRRADRRAELRERRARPASPARRAIAFAIPKSVTTAGAAGEQDVVRLDVAVHDAALVRVGERLRARRAGCSIASAIGTGPCGQPRAQGLALHERHRVVRQPVDVARREHRDDVRLLERRGDADLALEPLGATSPPRARARAPSPRPCGRAGARRRRRRATSRRRRARARSYACRSASPGRAAEGPCPPASVTGGEAEGEGEEHAAWRHDSPEPPRQCRRSLHVSPPRPLSLSPPHCNFDAR